MTTVTADPISAIVRVWLALTDTPQATVAAVIGKSEATVSRRLDHGGWRANELDRLAAYFDVPVGVFRVLVAGQTRRSPRHRALPGASVGGFCR